MNKYIQKSALAYTLFVLGSGYGLYATSVSSDSLLPAQALDYSTLLTQEEQRLVINGYWRRYSQSLISKELVILLTCFVYKNVLQYKNQKKLPDDLSEQDLSDYDFTGCHFTATNLTGSNLENVILTNTTCNYLKEFSKNRRQCKFVRGKSYLDDLWKDIKSITKIYPHVKKDEEKADLLLIACGISRFSLYEGYNFYIKALYWSCAWLHWKKTSGRSYSDIEQVCSLESEFHDFWPSQYPKDEMQVRAHTSHLNFYQQLSSMKAPHSDFNAYLTDFNHGFDKYVKNEVNFYSRPIRRKIKDLKRVYDALENEKMKEETCNIAYGYSQGYKVENPLMNYYMLFFKNRTVRLRRLVEKTNNNIEWESWIF